MSENVPVTTWQPTSGNGEFSLSGINYIVDNLNNNLADPTGNLIVDTGVTFTQIPTTIWSENDDV